MNKNATKRSPNLDIKSDFHIFRLIIITGGVVLNICILLFPLVFLGQIILGFYDLSLQLFLFLSSIFCIGELSHISETTGKTGNMASSIRDQQVFKLALLVGIGILATFWISIFERAYFQYNSSSIGVYQAIGIFIMSLGIGLRVIAVRLLGSYFVTEIKVITGQPLVRDGIYKRLRHPSELGLLCIAIGGCLILKSEIGLILCIVWILPLILFRIKLEERFLQEVFEEEFEGYVLSSRKILPYIY